MTGGFLKDVLRYIPARILPGIFGLLVLPLFTRLFNPGEYGVYTIILTTVGILTVVTNEWIGPSVIRFYSQYEKQNDLGSLGATLQYLGMASVGALSIIAAIGIWIWGSHAAMPVSYLWLGLILFIVTALAGLLLQLLVARRKANHYSFFTVWQQCICVVIGLSLAGLCSMGITGLLLGTILGIGLILPFLFRIAFHNISCGHYSKTAAGAIMSYGFPLMMTNLASLALRLSDRYVIQLFCGSHEVGLYSVSYSIADRSVSLVVSLLTLASGPIAMDLWEKEGVEQTRQFVHKVARFFLIVATPAAVGLSLLGKSILELLASSPFHGGYKIMPLIAASMFLLGLQRYFQLGLLFHKKTGIIMMILVASSALNIGLNFWLVPRGGFVAAGWTALAGYGVLTLLVIIVSRRYFTWIFPYRTLLKVVFSSLVMSGVIYGILGVFKSHSGVAICLAVIFGALSYGLVLLLIREVPIHVLKERYAAVIKQRSARTMNR